MPHNIRARATLFHQPQQGNTTASSSHHSNSPPSTVVPSARTVAPAYVYQGAVEVEAGASSARVYEATLEALRALRNEATAYMTAEITAEQKEAGVKRERTPDEENDDASSSD